MKLEFIKNINGYNEHAVRLSDFNSSQAVMFFGTVDRLIRNSGSPLCITDFSFIQPVNCHLTLRTSVDDQGISTADNVNFYCDLTIKTYQSIKSLLQPFCKMNQKDINGFTISTRLSAFCFLPGKTCQWKNKNYLLVS